MCFCFFKLSEHQGGNKEVHYKQTNRMFFYKIITICTVFKILFQIQYIYNCLTAFFFNKGTFNLNFSRTAKDHLIYKYSCLAASCMWLLCCAVINYVQISLFFNFCPNSFTVEKQHHLLVSQESYVLASRIGKKRDGRLHELSLVHAVENSPENKPASACQSKSFDAFNQSMKQKYEPVIYATHFEILHFLLLFIGSLSFAFSSFFAIQDGSARRFSAILAVLHNFT